MTATMERLRAFLLALCLLISLAGVAHGQEATPTAIEVARAELAAWDQEMLRTDPSYAGKRDALSALVADVRATHPPQKWLSATKLQYNLLSLSLLRSHRLSPECKAVEEARLELEQEARNLLACAGRRDLSNDCHREVRDVRYAGDELESAVSDVSEDCQ